MLEIRDYEVMGFRMAMKGMRNAMNSWDKSDSGYGCDQYDCGYLMKCNDCPIHGCSASIPTYIIGEEDMKLAKKLIKAGSSDRKFLRMIHVQADVTAPLYWWKEYDTYKVGTVANSCSTMHTIHKKEFTIDDFSHEHLCSWSLKTMQKVIDNLNIERKNFLVSKDKFCWWQMIQLLPSSFNQMRTIDLDYETLYSIYHQRRNHKLDEWREFCKWIETLPYMKEFLELDEQTETIEEENQ